MFISHIALFPVWRHLLLLRSNAWLNIRSWFFFHYWGYVFRCFFRCFPSLSFFLNLCWFSFSLYPIGTMAWWEDGPQQICLFCPIYLFQVFTNSYVRNDSNYSDTLRYISTINDAYWSKKRVYNPPYMTMLFAYTNTFGTKYSNYFWVSHSNSKLLANFYSSIDPNPHPDLFQLDNYNAIAA